MINKKRKKRTCRLVDFAVPAYHRVKMKESEKRDQNIDLAGELRKLWNMRVMMIPIVVGTLRTVSKDFERELDELKIEG